jgi:predicted RNA-binding Zn ribbon-like protein
MREQTAPGDLELVREFVNTRDVEEGRDELASASTADRWLAAHGLARDERPEAAAERERLVAVREALRDLLLANNGGEAAPPAALAVLNEQSAQAAIGVRFDPGGAELVTRCERVDAAIATLLSIVHGAIKDGTWPRLKACPADDCQWAFYDRSRNRSGTWCDMGECGNRAKARAYRERRKAESNR